MVFLLITVVGVAFVGAKYAQVDKLFFDEDYTVSASFAINTAPASRSISMTLAS